MTQGARWPAPLHFEVHQPECATRGVTLVCAHAMMVSSRVFLKPSGLVAHLREKGFRVVVFDFRGHGQSWPLASREVDWTYEDLVFSDIPEIMRRVKDVAGRDRVVWVGHSLGAHTMAVALGHGVAHVDKLVMLAGNIWLPSLDASARRRLRKRVLLEAFARSAQLWGYVPVTKLRLGTDDEARSYASAFLHWWNQDAFQTRARGEVMDHAAALANVRIPVLQITSVGDTLNCHPSAGGRFLSLMRRAKTTHRLVTRQPSGFAPSHIGLVTDVRSAFVWDEIASFAQSE